MTSDAIKKANECNHRGVFFFSQGRWSEAIIAYQQAIALRADCVDAYYNLGLVYNKLGFFIEAKYTYQTLLAIQPQHMPGRFQLALLLMRNNDFANAIQQFLLIPAQESFYFEVLVNLATCYLQLGKLLDAKSYYLQALELNPTDYQVLFNLGVISVQQGRIKEAMSFYLHVIQQLSKQANLAKEGLATLYAAHNNLGVTYLGQKDRRTALLHFRAALRLNPDHQALIHIIQLLENKETIQYSPLEYVHSLFNSYANHYDQHLRELLNYQVPGLLYEMIKNHAPHAHGQWKILDLGCGTGLCAEQLTAYASRISGVDISEEMLKIAASKNIYHELIQADILSFLQQHHQTYDLIVMGDVLPYFGSLNVLFSAIATVLVQKGWVGLSAEKSEQAEYEIKDTGRFGHQDQYLAKVFADHGFNVIEKKIAELRYQDEQPVIGYLYLLQLVD